MRDNDFEKDLVVLVSDKNMEFSVKGLFSRSQALGIRQVTYDIFIHPARDPGCVLAGHDFLRPFVNRYAHALVMFDREGCGQDHLSRDTLEHEMESRLRHAGWGDRTAVIVLDPELEVWVWSDSPHVDRLLGWAGKDPPLREWLRRQGYLDTPHHKPLRPKEAVETALKEARKARSSALYAQLARQVSVERCTDPAFVRFKSVLQRWFKL